MLAYGRAIIAVIALYALVLQAFFGFAQPVAAFDPSGSALCAGHATGMPADGKAQVKCHPCCTVAQIGVLGAPPDAAATSSWLWPTYIHVKWRPEATVRKTGPPVHAASARGPPAA